MTTEHEKQADGDLEEPWLPEGVTATEEDAPLKEAADDQDDEPEDSEDDDEELDEELRESYGADADSPWAPVPLAPAREFLRKNPEAKLDLVFPETFVEDRSQKIKDVITAEGVGMLSHHRATELVAQEFGLEQFDYVAEMEQIRIERAQYGDILGGGDALAARVAGRAQDDDDYNSAPERAEFRKRQREGQLVFVERPRTLRVVRDERGLISTITEEQSAAAPADPEVDLEAFYRQRREQLLHARAEAAADEGLGHVGDLPHSAELLAEARAQVATISEEKVEPLPKGPQLTKEETHYSFSDTTHQISLGVDPVCCGRCTHFRPPPTPSGVGGCELVQGEIRGTDRCDKFARSRTGRALAR